MCFDRRGFAGITEVKILTGEMTLDSALRGLSVIARVLER